jgi:hypothetical protein
MIMPRTEQIYGKFSFHVVNFPCQLDLLCVLCCFLWHPTMAANLPTCCRVGHLGQLLQFAFMLMPIHESTELVIIIRLP